MTTTRLLHLMACLCLAAVAIALVSQHVFGMQPCAWCVLQRLIYIGIAVACWLGAGLARPLIARAAALLAGLLAASGIWAAWHQYSVASQLFSCDLTLADRFMVQSGLDAGLPWLFGIHATCMDARVELLGVEYALWSMALFMIVLILSGWAVLKKP